MYTVIKTSLPHCHYISSSFGSHRTLTEQLQMCRYVDAYLQQSTDHDKLLILIIIAELPSHPRGAAQLRLPLLPVHAEHLRERPHPGRGLRRLWRPQRERLLPRGVRHQPVRQPEPAQRHLVQLRWIRENIYKY